MRRAVPLPVRRLLYDLSPSRRRRWRQFPALEEAPHDQGVVLTFDDGPDIGTVALLEALDREGIKAMFFVVGEQLEREPAIGRAIVDAGHEIGLHGYGHFRHDLIEPEASADDLRRGMECIESLLGVRPRWYRPPFGKFSPASYRECDSLGLERIYWSTWGHDWEPISAAEISAKVERGLRPGAVVLLHDSARYDERESPAATAHAVPLIARAVRDRGWRFGTLGAGVAR